METKKNSSATLTCPHHQTQQAHIPSGAGSTPQMSLPTAPREQAHTPSGASSQRDVSKHPKILQLNASGKPTLCNNYHCTLHDEKTSGDSKNIREASLI